MGIRGWVVVGGIAVGLGCSGLPVPPWEVPAGDVEGPDTAELVAAEDPDGKLSADERAAREASLALFLTLTPDFEDWRPLVLDRIAVHGETIEQNLATVKAEFAPKPPVDVPVTSDDWKVVTIVSAAYGTSEDWASFTADVDKAMVEKKVAVAQAGPGVRSLKVTDEGEELAVVDFAELVPERELVVGYVFAKRGADPVWQAHEPTESVVEAATKYFEGSKDEPEEVASGPAAAPAPAGPRPAAPPPVPEVVPVVEPVPEPPPVVAAPKPLKPLPDLEPEPVIDPKAKGEKGGKKK